MIWCPFATREEAEGVARVLVQEGLVACANILPGIVSIFRWNGAIDTAEEVAVLFKTDARLLSQAIAKLAVLHPYETPAIIGWKADCAPEGTQEWLSELVKDRRGREAD